MTKFGTNADGAIWWPNLKPIQVVPLWTVLTERFTQDMKSIPWVRCASGNVFLQIFQTKRWTVSWKLNLVWDGFVFLNFRVAIFLQIWFVFHSNIHFLICCKLVQNLVIRWRNLHWFQSWPLGWVTSIVTLSWNALLVLSVGILFVSLSARVTSVEFQKRYSLSERQPDP